VKRRTYLGLAALALAGCSSDGGNAGPGNATTGTNESSDATTSEGGSDPRLFDGSGATTTGTFELGGGITAFDMEHVGDGSFQAEPSLSLSGDSPDYEGPVEFSGETTFTGRYDSNGVFNVAVLDAEGSSTSVFSEMRSFEGEETVAIDGTGWVRVVANGEWELAVE